jgi:hypothetical protein
MSAVQRRGGDRPSRIDMVLGWCDALDMLRDQAKCADQPFMAFLLECALEHAIMLAMRENGASRVGKSEPS